MELTNFKVLWNLDHTIENKPQFHFHCSPYTGSPSSKYEHRQASALLRNIQNIKICMGKKTYRFCNLRK